jgi:hypothetical protein
VVDRARGGTMEVYWTPNPVGEGVDEYDVGYGPKDGAQPLAWQGLGTFQPGGTVITLADGTTADVSGKLKSPVFTGLDDLVEYDGWVTAHTP